MTSVALNEMLKTVLPVVDTASSPARVLRATRLPLLTTRYTSKEVLEASNEAVKMFPDGRLIPPFPAFRFIVDYDDDTLGTYSGLCEIVGDLRVHLLFHLKFRNPPQEDDDLIQVKNISRLVTVIKFTPGSGPEGRQVEADLKFYSLEAKRLLPEDKDYPMKSALKLASIVHTIMAALCFDFTSANNFVAKVTPSNGAGKSVEWLQAREHLVVISRNHAANKIGLPRGSKVNESDETRLKRVAHSRRAHFRLLSADRYTKMKGQKIRIKDTWVGPDEWRDSAGQIYRLTQTQTPAQVKAHS